MGVGALAGGAAGLDVAMPRRPVTATGAAAVVLHPLRSRRSAWHHGGASVRVQRRKWWIDTGRCGLRRKSLGNTKGLPRPRIGVVLSRPLLGVLPMFFVPQGIDTLVGQICVHPCAPGFSARDSSLLLIQVSTRRVYFSTSSRNTDIGTESNGAGAAAAEASRPCSSVAPWTALRVARRAHRSV